MVIMSAAYEQGDPGSVLVFITDMLKRWGTYYLCHLNLRIPKVGGGSLATTLSGITVVKSSISVVILVTKCK